MTMSWFKTRASSNLTEMSAGSPALQSMPTLPAALMTPPFGARAESSAMVSRSPSPFARSRTSSREIPVRGLRKLPPASARLPPIRGSARRPDSAKSSARVPSIRSPVEASRSFEQPEAHVAGQGAGQARALVDDRKAGPGIGRRGKGRCGP